jgi:hypothetical protein
MAKRHSTGPAGIDGAIAPTTTRPRSETSCSGDSIVVTQTITEKSGAPMLPPPLKIKDLDFDPEKPTLSESEPNSPTVQSPESEVPASIHGIPIAHTRPNVSTLIRSYVAETSNDERVLIVGCGPEGLLKEIRNTTASCIRPNGPGLELHCETFGW